MDENIFHLCHDDYDLLGKEQSNVQQVDYQRAVWPHAAPSSTTSGYDGSDLNPV